MRLHKVIAMKTLKLPIYQVNAFTTRFNGGNPAGVCLLDGWLSESILQEIATENGFSETAFVVKNEEKGYYEIRWFSPGCEIGLCGHATLASAFILRNEKNIDEETITFSSKRGVITVSIDGDQYILDMPKMTPELIEAPASLIRGLGVVPIDVLKSEDYLVIINDEETLRNLKPNFSLVQQIDLRGTIVSCRSNRSGIDFVSRWFGSEKVGVVEDQVTGSAHCTLAPYWSEKLGKARLIAKQLSHRQGDLVCEVQDQRVLISGQAVLYMKGHIFVQNTN